MNLNILVIGTGVSGLSAALAFLQRGHRVVILGRPPQEGMSTWAGAGILSPLPPWHYPEEVNRLALAGMSAWPGWIEALSSLGQTDPEYWRCGMAVLEEPDPREALDWCARHNVTCQNGGGFAQDALAPALQDHHLWLPDVAQVRNPRLVRSLLEAIKHLGGESH